MVLRAETLLAKAVALLPGESFALPLYDFSRFVDRDLLIRNSYAVRLFVERHSTDGPNGEKYFDVELQEQRDGGTEWFVYMEERNEQATAAYRREATPVEDLPAVFGFYLLDANQLAEDASRDCDDKAPGVEAGRWEALTARILAMKPGTLIAEMLAWQWDTMPFAPFAERRPDEGSASDEINSAALIVYRSVDEWEFSFLERFPNEGMDRGFVPPELEEGQGRDHLMYASGERDVRRAVRRASEEAAFRKSCIETVWDDIQKSWARDEAEQKGREEEDRARFEAWMKTFHHDGDPDVFLARNEEGDYIASTTEIAYEGWKARGGSK